jgi:magnesium-transporting ATPase (P-type)
LRSHPYHLLVAIFLTGVKALDAISIVFVCAVAMIPEVLAAIVTLAYARAMSTIAKQNAIVRVLSASETLAFEIT